MRLQHNKMWKVKESEYFLNVCLFQYSTFTKDGSASFLSFANSDECWRIQDEVELTCIV